MLSSPKIRRDIVNTLRSADIQTDALYALFSESFSKGGLKNTRKAIELVFGPLFEIAQRAMWVHAIS